MEVLAKIPFALSPDELGERLRIEPGSDDARTLDDLVRRAQKIGAPKAVYREAFIEAREGETVCIGGIPFTSPMLCSNLKQAERVFASVATCGTELDDVAPAPEDFLHAFWWDEIKARLLAAASRYLAEHLDARFRLGKTTTMSPGAGDVNVWPIEQQRLLFDLIGDVHAAIGVQLTDSFLMLPNKSVSCIRFPTERDFSSCQVCRRQNCPGRRAPLDEQLWREAQGPIARQSPDPRD